MGYLSDQKMTPHHKTKMKSLNDSGQLSLDFLVGISIFATILIIASTMISGLLIGLEAKKIDFDAVAYRTGVILVEDPGEPSKMAFDLTVAEEQQWEFVGLDQKDKIRRFGLALYKSTPRVLAEQKIFSFFNRSKFPDLSEYRERIIAGDYPYSFNISLRSLPTGVTYFLGEPYNPNSTYGYIRRMVLVKGQTMATVDMNRYNVSIPDSSDFYVNISYNKLLNQSWGPQYWIEPPKEDITINLGNMSSVKNQSSMSNVKLKNIKMTFDGILLDGREVTGVDLPYRDFVVKIDGTDYTFVWPDGAAGSHLDVTHSLNITFPAGYFIPPSAYADVTLIRMTIHYEFEPTTVNLSSSNNRYEYIPGNVGFTPSSLTPAVLEVRVW
ncbi:MAG: hypothetical protein NQU46_04935 [Methanolinea sp.]|nr:hypothetical protein [Methanolinea sp.]